MGRSAAVPRRRPTRSAPSNTAATIHADVDRSAPARPEEEGAPEEAEREGALRRERRWRSGSDNRRLLMIAGGAATRAPRRGGGVLRLRGRRQHASADAPKLLETAGCTVQAVKSLPSNDHSITVPTGTSKKWNTDPPTSGPHYAQWVVWGAYTDPVNLGQVVHNLEHGGIYILYGKNVPQATVERAADVLRQAPERDGPRAASAPREQGRARRVDDEQREPAQQRHRPPRQVHDVRREGIRGVLLRLPGEGPGALPAVDPAARLVAATSRLAPSRGGETGHTRPT